MLLSNYENDRTLVEYLLLHYGNSDDLLHDLPGPKEAIGFPTRIITELLDASRLPPLAKALDVGCAVGASTFELARYCHHVIGIDFSQKFISAATALATHGELSTEKTVEGELTAPFTARVPKDIPRSQVRFRVGDATHLPSDMGTFHVVLASNLLCRLPAPEQFLKTLPSLLHPGGQLLLATPFSWLEEVTPPATWLGGKHPKDRPGWEMLKEILFPHFELEEKKNIPFLIREHARKFQYGISLGSRWIRSH